MTQSLVFDLIRDRFITTSPPAGFAHNDKTFSLSALLFPLFMSILQKLESQLGAKHSPSLHEKKLFQSSERFVALISWIPGLRMVAVSNSLAMYATHKESDIDMFIVTAPGRMWLVRTLVLMVATLLKVRAKPGNEAGKFCFPFFMTERHLSLRNIAIENDVYLAYWIRTLKPIYNTNYTYGRFMKMNEAFCTGILGEQWNEEVQHALLEENRKFLKRTRRGAFFDNHSIKNPLSPLLSFIDRKIGEVSLRRIEKNPIPSTRDGIRVTAHMIKLHYNDRRMEIRDQVLGII